MRFDLSCLFALLYVRVVCNALDLDLDNLDSMKRATALIADGLLDYYGGLKQGGEIGMFVWPYYWWHAGAAWGSMIDYWFYMENDTYNNIVQQALLYQVGENNDYVPSSQIATEGNDDQAFWGLAAIAAAERNFPNPPDGKPQWLALAQAVFNTMSYRWDDQQCGGGLRWQIFQFNNGYDYKNTVSNGGLFHLAARLARYTGNQTYADWAVKVYDWLEEIHLLNATDGWMLINDGINVANNCDSRSISPYQWSYNHGFMLSGCAYMYNFTKEEIWYERLETILNTASIIFFKDDVMYEQTCQGCEGQPGCSRTQNCNVDQRCFKAFFARFLGLTGQLIPAVRDKIDPLLRASAKAASESCVWGRDGHTCVLNWISKKWDDKGYGLGEQMSALEFIQNTRYMDRPPPHTALEGGTSLGDPGAGAKKNSTIDVPPLHIGAKDKVGASLITAVFGLSLITCFLWLVL